jgi:hypothetical protein
MITTRLSQGAIRDSLVDARMAIGESRPVGAFPYVIISVTQD